MVELRPVPFAVLVTRMLRELEEQGSIFDLPQRKFHIPDPARDLSVHFHGQRAGTPLGPAAGPQSQLAQNLVLSWLGGCRILELKTVQLDDELDIPRPCIDMQTVGFNVEWSQELKLEESLAEYVKGAMLIEILAHSAQLPINEGLEATVFDMSVGYDLAGIQSERVQAFIAGLLDCSSLIERFRSEIPDEYAALRRLEFPTRLSDTLTLSTFHGCPPDEIESICDFLLKEVGLHTIVKLNPMLAGPQRCRELLNEVLGYHELRVPDSAFERDTRWDQMTAFVERLGQTAEARELGFGVKFTNTLIVENRRDFFPSDQREMYLSGAPLHVLAMDLVHSFRREFGDRYPISFSGGIDRKNFADAVAQGIVPVTVCSDLLRPGGYGRACGYLSDLGTRMDAIGASTVDAFVRATAGCEDLEAARIANTQRYHAGLMSDERYSSKRNAKPPKKIGSELELFDCIACDKCVPVCPNDANFSFELPPQELPILFVTQTANGWTHRVGGAFKIERERQWANFADFCNDCGNCDVFCPEDGGPYKVKPRFFGTLADWRSFDHLDGFYITRQTIHARMRGHEYTVSCRGERYTYEGAGFRLELDANDPSTDLRGEAACEVDLTVYLLLRILHSAIMKNRSLAWPTLLAKA